MFSLGIGKSLATYPANLCPLLWGAEFAEFGSDFGEPVCQSIKDGQGITGVGQRAPKHFHYMLRNLYSLQGAAEVGVEANDGLGWGQEMPGLGTGGAKLTLKVGLCELGVEQSHFC